MKTKQILLQAFFVVTGSLLAVFVYSKFLGKEKMVIIERPKQQYELTALANDKQPVDFVYAAEKTVHAVVHVKTKSKSQAQPYNPLYEFFYGDAYRNPQERVTGYGSGVFIKPQGYIVTNNHVIKEADEIIVKLNDNREYTAKLVGADPSTDIAVLKVDGEDLPFVEYGNSDDLRLGEWVLAVGNPFNLTSTVTAGIVSAKARNLGILDDSYRIESFIQTDAALNPGNSGGALVNIKGELVGINTAIISPSGGYSGNSFAVPVSIVKKVVEDLIEYGTVQRAILGISIKDMNAELAKETGMEKITGVYIDAVMDDGAASASGIKKGDVILSINSVAVASTSELQEQISKYRPNQVIKVAVHREGKIKEMDVRLKNLYGDTSIVKSDEGMNLLGAVLRQAKPEELSKLKLNNGLVVTEVKPGKFLKAGIEKGFIITRLNSKPVRTLSELKEIIERTKGGIYIEGVYPNGVIAYYAFGM